MTQSGIRPPDRLLPGLRLPHALPQPFHSMGTVCTADRIAQMSGAKPHLRTLEEIERTCVSGLVEVLRTEGIEGVRYALWDMTDWHRDYDPCVWRSRATDEQKRERAERLRGEVEGGCAGSSRSRSGGRADAAGRPVSATRHGPTYLGSEG